MRVSPKLKEWKTTLAIIRWMMANDREKRTLKQALGKLPSVEKAEEIMETLPVRVNREAIGRALQEITLHLRSRLSLVGGVPSRDGDVLRAVAGIEKHERAAHITSIFKEKDPKFKSPRKDYDDELRKAVVKFLEDPYNSEHRALRTKLYAAGSGVQTRSEDILRLRRVFFPNGSNPKLMDALTKIRQVTLRQNDEQKNRLSSLGVDQARAKTEKTASFSRPTSRKIRH